MREREKCAAARERDVILNLQGNHLDASGSIVCGRTQDKSS
jgi:hypothetical protein